MSEIQEDELLKVEKVDAFISPSTPHVPVIALQLENGEQFILYYVPYEIVLSINRLEENHSDSSRESLFDILPHFTSFIDELDKSLVRVIINELNPETMLYTAIAEFNINNLIIHRRMIPSHAIYLAMLANKPIYVDRDLVRHQATLRNNV